MYVYMDMFFSREPTAKTHHVFSLKDGVLHHTIVSCFKINILLLGPPNMNGTEKNRLEF